MISEGALLKTVGISTAVALAEFLPRLLNDGLGALALVAAGLGGFGFLTKLARRGWHNARAFISRAVGVFDIVESTPSRLDQVDRRLDDHGTALEKHGDLLDVLADADRLRIKDAISGADERSLVDRRSSG